MLAAYECYGDLDFLNLGFLSKTFLGKVNPSYKEILGNNSSPWDIPLAKLAEHATADAKTTFQLHRFFLKEISLKGLSKQYFYNTMPLCLTLGELEYCGVKVDREKICQLRDIIIKKANKLMINIRSTLGRDIDIDSDEEVKHYLLSDLSFSEWNNFNRPFTSLMEYLGITHDVPRHIVQYRRLLKDVQSIDVIIKSIKDNKIFPIFSQVKSKNGNVTTKQPDILDALYLEELPLCFERQIQPCFSNPLSAINRIQELAGDEVLKHDMSNRSGVNTYLSNHPTVQTDDCNSLLLSMVSDMPYSKMINQFFIDKRDLLALRQTIESRYPILFSFLNKYKTESLKRGFSEINGKRKYLIGLKGPNLVKRRNAEQFALKWLIAQ